MTLESSTTNRRGFELLLVMMPGNEVVEAVYKIIKMFTKA
jgi:hypothetical protein